MTRQILIVGGLLAALVAGAASLRVSWEPIHDEMLLGYRVYLGTNTGVYDTNFFTTNTTQALRDLPAGKYFLLVRGVDTNGLPGEASEELAVSILPAPEQFRVDIPEGPPPLPQAQ